MKTFFKKYKVLGLFILILAGCNEEPELTVLRDVAFPSAIEVSVNEIVITENNFSNSAILTVNWPAVDYLIGAPVEYAVQISTPADTVGAEAWGNAKNVKVGVDILTKDFKAKDLNKYALGFGLEANVPGIIVLRVKSYVDRDAFSKAATIAFTPYEKVEVVEPELPEVTMPSLWIPGDYQGWDPATATRIVDRGTDIYEGYFYIPEGGTNEFKITTQAAWEPMAYGDGGDGLMVEANSDGGNFVAPGNGYFMLTANLVDMTYTLTQITWSILGDATPGAWDVDTQMEYDVNAQVWKLTADMLANGSFKFRANNEWIIDFAIDAEGNFLYADHPVLGYTADLNNLTVPEDGNYTLILDLHDPENYKYELRLN